MNQPAPERLPIDHPGYRYTQSKNIYWKKLQTLAGQVYSDNETEAHTGRWRDRFAAPAAQDAGTRELHVEIGCNAGHVLVEWAARDAERGAYVGIDWKFKPIFRAAEKAQKRSLSNVLLFRAHAERIGYMFGEGEVDFVHVYFPDPWSKNSQRKNRFVTAERLRELHRILRPGGELHIKTDHAEYFEWMEAAIARTASLWDVRERTTDLHAANPAAGRLTMPEVTLFEKLFIADGIRICSVKLGKK